METNRHFGAQLSGETFAIFTPENPGPNPEKLSDLVTTALNLGLTVYVNPDNKLSFFAPEEVDLDEKEVHEFVSKITTPNYTSGHF